MTETHYELIIYWDAKDKIFVVEVPELPGCSAHGETKKTALANVEKAVRLWIQTAEEDGAVVPQPKGRLLYA